MKDYIVLDIGKIVIVRKNNSRKYYKEVNGELFELSNEELLGVIKIFNKNNSYDYDSEKLSSLVNINNNIDATNKNYLLVLLEFLERIIPENCRDNFYKNLETISIQLNFDCHFSTLSNGNDKKNYSQSGGYNTRSNELKIIPESLKKIWEIAQTTNNPIEFYQKEVSQTILHELSHMASSNYNCDTMISKCGFDTYPSTLEKERNRGLTEGMTEVIAMAGVPGTIEIASRYYIEALFINQLIQIVGIDVMVNSYFSNLGTENIEAKLNEIIDDENLSYSLFRRIEDNYQVKDIDTKQTLLGNIQTTLITYFNEKISKQLLEKQLTIEEAEAEFNKFEQMLVTKQRLEIMKKNPENYVGLNESIEQFYDAKNKLKKTYSNSGLSL